MIRRGYSSTGGAERYLLRFADGLESAGHEVVLFSDRKWPEEVWDTRKRKTILVGAVPETSTKVSESKLTAMSDRAAEICKQKRAKLRQSPLSFAQDLDELNPREHCDFLFSLERVWDCDCFRAGDGVHAAWLERRAKFESPVRTFFRRFSSKHRQIIDLERAIYSPPSKTHVIANSAMVSQEIRDIYRTEPDRITVIPNGYDLPENTPAGNTNRTEERRRLGLRPEETAFLFVGSGWKRKGLEFAAYATQRIHQLEGKNHQLKLLVAGKDRRSAPRSSKKIPIEYLGPLSAEQLGRVYLAADVFVLPTTYDPFSNATLEAAAHGLPVITTDANGFYEHMPPFEGSVVKNPKGGELLTAFREWMANPNRREKARTINREKATEFSVKKNVEQSLNIFLQLVHEKKSSPHH